MDDKKVTGSRKSLQSMLFYHLVALSELYENPRGMILEEIADMITLSEDQLKYVKLKLGKNASVDEQLEMASKLTDGMMKEKKLDMEALNIIKGLLDETVKQIREVDKEFTVEEG